MTRMLRLSKDAADAEADATCLLMDGGYLRLYGGTQPETVETPVETQPLLAECRFNNPAFKLSLDGRSVANPIKPDTETRARGRATWFRTYRADGTTAVLDGSVGQKALREQPQPEYDLTLGTVEIIPGMEVHIEQFAYVRRMK